MKEDQMETSKVSGQVIPTSRYLGQILRQYPLFFFFLFAYLISWILVLPFILSEWGVLSGDFTIAFIIKSYGPFLAAYIMLRVTEGKEGVLRLRKSIRQGRAGWGWYLFVLLGIPSLILLGIILQPGMLAGFQGLRPILVVSYLTNYILVFFGGGPLGEEPGWRGFALPRMQSRFGPLRGTLLLGILWTCWHLPDFLTSAQGGGPGIGLDTFLKNFPMFLLLVTALAVIFTWIFNHTRGSVFLALLAHASVNTPQLVLVPLFPVVDFTGLDLAALIAFVLPALLIIILTRGRLGYGSGQEQSIGQEEFKTHVSI
jgi:membrane protease YdiL (CAAX protease family)